MSRSAEEGALMRIQTGEFFKAVLQRCLAGFHLAVRNAKDIRQDLEASPDTVARILHEVMVKVNANVQSEYHRQQFAEVAEFLLWVATKDTAYTSQRDALLLALLDRADDLRAVLKSVPPEMWTVNVHANREKKGGMLPR